MNYDSVEMLKCPRCGYEREMRGTGRLEFCPRRLCGTKMKPKPPLDMEEL